jgi:hypothetical protein
MAPDTTCLHLRASRKVRQAKRYECEERVKVGARIRLRIKRSEVVEWSPVY